MTFSLTWLPDVLKGAGLKVAPVAGFENRGRGDAGQIFGVLCHHTAGPKNGNMPSLNTLINGRTGSDPLHVLKKSRWGAMIGKRPPALQCIPRPDGPLPTR